MQEQSEGTGVCAHLRDAHVLMRRDFPHICRIAVALYDDQTDALRTFAHSTRGEAPFVLYEAGLKDVPSLETLAEAGRSRVVDDLRSEIVLPTMRNERLRASGLRSSYTRPVFENDRLFGFVFFNADTPHYFTPSVLDRLTVYDELLTLAVINDLSPVRNLRAAVRLAKYIGKQRDNETGRHLDRMAHYARLVAKGVAAGAGRNDEYVEFVFLYAPLHDIGKVAIPDAILEKPARLTADEYETMKTHVVRGVAIVDELVTTFALGPRQHPEILHNIVAAHHECVDGGGYPRGLRGDDVPLEGRIIAVADVFDALTSPRRYKPAWTVDDALRYLEDNAGHQFDPACVAALEAERPAFEAVRARFPENDSVGTAA